MTTDESISNAKLFLTFLTIFGKKEGQSTVEFAKEIEGVKGDEKFLAECRAHAIATLQASTASPSSLYKNHNLSTS